MNDVNATNTTQSVTGAEHVVQDSTHREPIQNETKAETKAETNDNTYDSDVEDAQLNDITSVSPSTSYDHVLKFIVVGNSSVGKSNLTLRFTKDEFLVESDTTIGVEYTVKTVVLKSKVYKIQIWDTAGQETFKTITQSYYRGAHGCIIAFDITNRESFDAVRGWYSDVKDHVKPRTSSFDHSVTVALVGNKLDLADQRVVSYDEAKSLANELGCRYFETSACTSVNVKLLFCSMVVEIDKKINEGALSLLNSTANRNGVVTLDDQSGSYYSYCPC